MSKHQGGPRRAGVRAQRGPRRVRTPRVEALEARLALAYSGGTGAVVTGLAIGGPDRSAIVASFDGPLDPASAQNAANYQVGAAGRGNPEFVTAADAPVPVLAAAYDPATYRVTLQLGGSLALGQFYRVRVDGTPGAGVRDINTTTDPASGATTATVQTIDGDADDTEAGDFYGLVGLGRRLTFRDREGDTATVRASGRALVQAWRQINGDLAALSVVGAAPGGRTVLSGSVRPARGGDGQVVLGSTPGGLANVVNRLDPHRFPLVARADSSPSPVVATRRNLPYTLSIEEVPLPSAPAVQSAVVAQAGGRWLVFGGRTNGLHNFDPSGAISFPPVFQDDNVYVIDPATGVTITRSWAETGLPASVYASLASSNQESYQDGDRLVTIGGYSSTPDAQGNPVFRTYDTLTSINVAGLIDAIVAGGSAVGAVRQIRDPRFRLAGGDADVINGRTYLVFGQDFEGGYQNASASISQVYSSEIRSFRLVDDGTNLGIVDYQAQRDPVNFRRRDGNLARTVDPQGRPTLTYLGGVFTVPEGGGYRNPVPIGPDGVGRLDRYQQYFSQYTAANISLFDARTRSLATVLFGGIGLSDYNFATGALTQDPNLPFVDDVTSLVRTRTGAAREYIMPSQLPGRYGAEAAFLAAPGLPTYGNGVVKLRDLKGPTTLGYLYGGVVSAVANTTDPATQTTASAKVFRVTLTPTR